MHFLIKILTPLTLLMSLSLHAQPDTDTLDRLLRAAFSGDRPGGALLVMNGGKVVYEKTIGLRDTESKKPLTARSNFRMASVSKQFTAMAILLLEKEGKLSFDDPVTRFFPDFATVGHRITVGQLLTHSSGVWAYEDVMPDTLTRQLSDAGVLEMIRHVDRTYFAPGTGFRYSNSGYCLLALIVEQVSGLPFPEFLRENIFRPLGMKQTRVYEAGEPIRRRAYGFALRDGQLAPSDQSLTSATQGDGGVYTSLRDYARWAGALRGNRLVDLRATLHRLNAPLGDGEGYYGAGWFFDRDVRGTLTLFHSGSTCGFSNVAVLVPEQGVCIAFFSNIAGNHEAFAPIYAYLQGIGLVEADIWKWHGRTD
jgi:CubicO group peptidase (beta-lactamase class C family)